MKKRRRFLLTALALALILGPTLPVTAEIGSPDATPAATLLLPYFEVALDDPNGVNTLFSVHNASADPAVVHVILWTNLGIPTIGFDMYLTGYDVETINLRQIFYGNLPITADLQTDPGDTISPKGPLSNDASFPFCDNNLPFENPELSPLQLDRLRSGHTGQPVIATGGRCLGQDVGLGLVATGYITMDNVRACSLIGDPESPAYFLNGGNGIASNVNQLWGDWFIVDPVNNFAQGDNLVHIQADGLLTSTNLPLEDPGTPDEPTDPNSPLVVATVANATGYTFYGRYFGAQDGRDNREPLGTIWAARYLNGGMFAGGTDLLVWRDSTAWDPSSVWAGVYCGVGPDWYPLNETEVLAFDTAEDAVELCFFSGDVIFPPDEFDPPCFPLATGRYSVGAPPLAVPFDFGWLYLNLNLPPDGPTGDKDFPPPDGNIAQSWVTTVHSADGLLSVGLPAIQLSGALQDVNDYLNTGSAPHYP